MTIGADVLAAVLNAVWQGLALSALVWLALRVARLGAAARYAIWMGTLAVLAALPVLNLLEPSDGGAAVAAGGGVAIPSLVLPAGHWTRWAFAGWAAISSLLLARLVWSYFSLARLKRLSQPAGIREHLGAAVRYAQVPVPVAAGLWKPAILLPAGLAEELSPAELDQVLLHEQAHLDRRDDWTNLAARLIQSVLFFQPAVWFIARRMSVEREIACDDRVVENTGAAVPYAACLLKVAGSARLRRGPQLAHAAISGRREFTLRIEALLAATRAVRSPKAVVGAALAFLAAVSAAAPRFSLISAALPADPSPALHAAAVTPQALARPVPRPRQPVIARRRAPASAMPVVAMRKRAPERIEIDTYYVLYLNETGPRWIQILWVHPLAGNPKLDGA